MPEPLYTVEELGEWMLAVYEGYVLSIDYYEGFAEITFSIEI
jgi:hypothetical protein